jgi:hypothetical protein
MKEIRKQKKKRERKRKKNRKGRRETVQPSRETSPRPNLPQSRIGTAYPLPLADMWAPSVGPRQSSSSLDRKPRRRPFLPSVNSPSSFRINPPTVSSPPRAYKKPWSSSAFALSFSLWIAARPAQFLTGARSFRRRLRSLSTESVSPSPSL